MELTSVIVVDLDGTVVDVTERLAIALEKLGYDVEDKTKEEIEQIIDNLRRGEIDKFYDIFLSDEYVYLDEYKEGVIDDIVAFQRKVNVPAVIITGRPVRMKSTEDVIKYLERRGLDVIDSIVRADSVRIPTEIYKVKALKLKGYDPVAIFDDDVDVLAELKLAFPSSRLFYAGGDRVVEILSDEEVPILGKL